MALPRSVKWCEHSVTNVVCVCIIWIGFTYSKAALQCIAKDGSPTSLTYCKTIASADRCLSSIDACILDTHWSRQETHALKWVLARKSMKTTCALARHGMRMQLAFGMCERVKDRRSTKPSGASNSWTFSEPFLNPYNCNAMHVACQWPRCGLHVMACKRCNRRACTQRSDEDVTCEKLASMHGPYWHAMLIASAPRWSERASKPACNLKCMRLRGFLHFQPSSRCLIQSVKYQYVHISTSVQIANIIRRR